jgi:hypothetical protein
VPLDICDIVLGIPYLFDKKVVLYQEENEYHIFKDGVEYIVIYHRIKANVSLVSTGGVKRLVSTRKSFVLMIVKQKEEDIKYDLSGYNPNHKWELIDIISNYNKFF